MARRRGPLVVVGVLLAAVLIVWRRDLRAIVRLLAWQGVALAAIPVVRGLHDAEMALVAVPTCWATEYSWLPLIASVLVEVT